METRNKFLRVPCPGVFSFMFVSSSFDRRYSFFHFSSREKNENLGNM